MKTRIFCACLITMLLVSTAAFSEIMSDGTGTSSNANASASKGDSSQWDYDNCYWSEWTTIGGTFTWSIEADAYGYAEGVEGNGWFSANVDTYGVAASPYSYIYVNGDFYYSDTQGTGGGCNDPDAETDSGTDWFGADQGVSAGCEVWAYAAIEEGSTSSCFCTGSATGSASLSEH